MSRASREQIIRAVIREVRGWQSASEAFDDAVSDAIGLTRNEHRCVDLIDQHGRITAGELARLSGLTTGAITGLIDRLEGRGLVLRQRDASDRRRVFIETTDSMRDLADPIYARHFQQAGAVFDAFSAGELEVIADFMRRGREMNERSLARVQQENGTTRPPIAPS